MAHLSDTPSEEERQALQDELVRLVGTGRIPVKLFDALVQVVWSAEDHGPLEEIRRDYLLTPPPQTGRPVRPVASEFALPGTDAPIKVGWELKRKGEWTVPAFSAYETKGGILKLDFRYASFEAPTATVRLDASWMADIQVVVAPEFGLVDRTVRTWGTTTEMVEPRRPHPGQPTIILEGTIAGCYMKVKTKPAKKR